MRKITIAGKEIPLEFNLSVWAEIEENLFPVTDLKEEIVTGKKRVRNVAELLRIMSAAAGEELTAEWFMQNVQPCDMGECRGAILDTFYLGMLTQTEREKRQRDLVLEEIEKKEEPGS